MSIRFIIIIYMGLLFWDTSW